MKYSLRSLMIVAMLAPPLLAGCWSGWKEFWREEPEEILLPHRIRPGSFDRPFKSVDWQAAMEKDDAIFGEYARYAKPAHFSGTRPKLAQAVTHAD